MGKKATVIYVMTVGLGAILSGLFFDTFLSSANLIHAAMNHHHAEGGAVKNVLFGVLMALVLINSIWGSALRYKIRSLFRSGTKEEESEMEVTIQGMTCMRCVGAVEKRLAEVPGIKEVHVELPTGRARL